MSELERLPSAPAQELATIQPEGQVEQRAETLKEAAPESRPTVSDTSSVQISEAQSQSATQDTRTDVLKQVENLLSDGLQQLYFSLPEPKRAAFKQKGEAVAQSITDMIIAGKAKVKEVWRLIGDWLKTVTGVNAYFLEQEIKIRTDRIMMFAESIR